MGSGRYVNSDSALYLEAANVPEFAELVKRAKNEAEQLWRTINQLEIFEIRFDIKSTSDHKDS